MLLLLTLPLLLWLQSLLLAPLAFGNWGPRSCTQGFYKPFLSVLRINDQSGPSTGLASQSEGTLIGLELFDFLEIFSSKLKVPAANVSYVCDCVCIDV